jgi:NADPH2:quinone reductase
MKAVVLRAFGGPDELAVAELADPVAGPGQVLVAVRAAGTNPVDASNRQDGSWAGLTVPCVLGYDIAGVVEATGPGVEGFAVGDRVMGMTGFPGGAGGYAELVAVAADHVVRLDASVGFVAAAASPIAGGTALDLLDRLALAPGQTLLVLAASGGVGSFLLRLAAARGLRVIAVGSAGSHDRMRADGASACIDYQSEDVGRRALLLADGPVDAIADLVGGDALAAALPAVRDGGALASIETPVLDLEILVDRNLTFHGILLTNRHERLVRLAELLARNVIQPRIAHLFPLAEAAAAHRLLDSHHSGGKIVLAVREPVEDGSS